MVQLRYIPFLGMRGKDFVLRDQQQHEMQQDRAVDVRHSLLSKNVCRYIAKI